MFLVPRGDPLYLNVPSASCEPPELLEMLRNLRLSGYACATFADAAGIFLFCDGRLLDAGFEHQSRRHSDLEAIRRIFELLASESGSLGIYQLSPNLARNVQALFRGRALFEGESLKLLDVEGLLGKLKVRRFTGCLRVRGEACCSLIFYREGSPLGFFHDGSKEIETSAAEYQKIAGLPEARLDAFESPISPDTGTLDLQEVVDVRKLWSVVRQRHRRERDEITRRLQETQQKGLEARLQELTGKLGESAVSHLDLDRRLR